MTSTTQTKKINWLFPDPDVEVTLEDYGNKIREDERSGSMTLKEFNQRHLQWWAENIINNKNEKTNLNPSR